MKRMYWICDGYPFKSVEAARRHAIRTKQTLFCKVEWLTEKDARVMGYVAVGEEDPQYDGWGSDWTQD